MELLPEIGDKRLKSMDEAGITVQVLSNTGPGPDLVPGPDGLVVAREMNNVLAAAIARHPDRFAGFAVLPMQSPDACAAELVRAVKELHFLGALINGLQVNGLKRGLASICLGGGEATSMAVELV